MSESNLPMLPPTAMEVTQKNMPVIIRGNEMAVALLKEIQKTPLTNDEERAAAIERLTKVKAIYDKVDALVKQVVDPIEAFVDAVKAYKKPLDYTSKTKDGNEYTRAKAVIEAYDQAKAKEAERVRLAAEFQKRQTIYKAELKEAVGRQLVDMIAGQKRTVIQAMAKWEENLTLANLDASYEMLEKKKPVLKEEVWSKCFHTSFIAPNSTLLTPKETETYIEELKKEFPLEKYSAEYAEAVAPIINEYRAKKEQVRSKLEEIARADAAQKETLELKRKEELEKKAQGAIYEVNQKQNETLEQLEHSKEMDKMNAEFTAQIQTQDIEDKPMRKEASFENEELFLKPFAEVIGACVLHPKFPGIKKKNGKDNIDAVQWWLDWFADHCEQTVKGIVITKVPKTIIRK